MKIIAHRGFHKQEKENTKEAIFAALDHPKMDGVEFDVRMTKDRKLVILHNMTIDKACNGTGFVFLKTLKELQQYNFGTKENPRRIATLEEVLKKISSKKIIMVELKHETDVLEEYLNALERVVKKYPYLNYYFCSFHEPLIRTWKNRHPSFCCGLLVGPFLNQRKKKDLFQFLSYEYHLELPKTKQELFLWTLNHVQPVESNVTGIITDAPELWLADNLR